MAHPRPVAGVRRVSARAAVRDGRQRVALNDRTFTPRVSGSTRYAAMAARTGAYRVYGSVQVTARAWDNIRLSQYECPSRDGTNMTPDPAAPEVGGQPSTRKVWPLTLTISQKGLVLVLLPLLFQLIFVVLVVRLQSQQAEALG